MQANDTLPSIPGEFVNFAVDLCRKIAAPIINCAYNDYNLAFKHKPDRSPVTSADTNAEEAMRRSISARYPSHGVLGEEFGEDRCDAEWVWVIDPIDGTLAFIHGVPLFTTLVGLLYQGQPVLGAIHQPTQDVLCLGYEDKCLLNGKPVRCADTAALEECTLLCTDFENVEKFQPERLATFNTLRKCTSLNRTWADGYGYLMVASGRAHIMLDPVVNPWDVLPVIPVIRGSGAIITDWRGNASGSLNSACAAAPGIHAQVIRILNS